MNAITLAKKLYPHLHKEDIILGRCPHDFLIFNKMECKNIIVDIDCVKCWDKEVDKNKTDWLLQCKNLCDLMC